MPPLEGRKVLTPELRSVTTPEQLVKENIPFAPEIVDLGKYDCEFSVRDLNSVQYLILVVQITF